MRVVLAILALAFVPVAASAQPNTAFAHNCANAPFAPLLPRVDSRWEAFDDWLAEQEYEDDDGWSVPHQREQY